MAKDPEVDAHETLENEVLTVQDALETKSLAVQDTPETSLTR